MTTQTIEERAIHTAKLNVDVKHWLCFRHNGKLVLRCLCYDLILYVTFLGYVHNTHMLHYRGRAKAAVTVD